MALSVLFALVVRGEVAFIGGYGVLLESESDGRSEQSWMGRGQERERRRGREERKVGQSGKGGDVRGREEETREKGRRT